MLWPFVLPELRSRITVFASACLAGLLAWWLAFGRGQRPDRLGLVPLPTQVVEHHGRFLLRPQTRILVSTNAFKTGEYLAQQLRRSTGLPLPVGLETASPAGDI